MALFDDYDSDISVTTGLDNVGNTTTTNNASLAVDLDNVGNSDTSTTGSDNLTVDVDNSFQEGSYNESWDLEHSLNEGSYNDTITITDSSENDNSVNAGVREYNLGFAGDLALGGGGAGGGDVMVNNENTVVDQSVNGNILSGHGVFGHYENESVLASGDGAMAAGDDISVSQSVDRSTDISAGGDVLIDSEKTVDFSYGSDNVTTVDVSVVDNSIDVDLDEVGNEYSATLDIENSFNDEYTDVSLSDWDVDASLIWDSEVETADSGSSEMDADA